MFAKFIVLLAIIATAFGLRANVQMKVEMPSMKKVISGAMAGILATSSFQLPAQALTSDQIKSLSYEQVKGTGIANRCPETSGEDTISFSSGKKYKITDFCMEPKQFMVEVETLTKKGEIKKEFVNTKLMTRQTYSLNDISGTVVSDGSKVTFTEEDGIDYSATTVQLPGGARVPYLFSLKNLVATGNGAAFKPGFEMGGKVTVPSYRTGLFLDPKGRGTTTGYDYAVQLPGLQSGTEGDAELFKENNKRFEVLQGQVELAITKVNAADGEFSGVFVSNQPSDTDMGAKEPKNIMSKGAFFGHIEAVN